MTASSFRTAGSAAGARFPGMPIEIRRFGVGHRRPDGPIGSVGLTGQDGAFIHARKMLLKSETNHDEFVDIGLVGEIERIDPELAIGVAGDVQRVTPP